MSRLKVALLRRGPLKVALARQGRVKATFSVNLDHGAGE
jgi:hypothetical protein